jgi:TonB family protein
MPQKNTINTKAATWTIAVHALLLLLFMFVSYSLPASAPVQELGMEVNLGNSDDGSGTNQPMSVEAPSVAHQAATASGAAAAQNIHEAEETDDAEAPPIRHTNTATGKASVPTPVKNNTPSVTEQTKKAPPQAPKYVYKGSTGNGGNNATTNAPGTSEGNTTGPGDRGVPGGTPGAANYTGTPGAGNGGITHTLSGRNISPAQFVAEFRQAGKVVIRVTVDRDGNIVNKSVVSSPAPELTRIALQKLSQAHFSKNPNAEPQQFGYITIVFKTHS